MGTCPTCSVEVADDQMESHAGMHNNDGGESAPAEGGDDAAAPAEGGDAPSAPAEGGDSAPAAPAEGGDKPAEGGDAPAA